MQSAFSFILCNCIHVFFYVAQPVHIGICLIWQLLLNDRWFYAKTVYRIQFDMMHSLWCQQQKIWKAFPHSFYKIIYFCTNIWFVELCYLCLLLLPAVLDSEQTQSRITLCVYVLFCTGRGHQCAVLWGRHTATSVFFTRRPAAKNGALARHIVDPVLVHTHRHKNFKHHYT